MSFIVPIWYVLGDNSSQINDQESHPNQHVDADVLELWKTSLITHRRIQGLLSKRMVHALHLSVSLIYISSSHTFFFVSDSLHCCISSGYSCPSTAAPKTAKRNRPLGQLMEFEKIQGYSKTYPACCRSSNRAPLLL
jgi:hypothetical protein